MSNDLISRQAAIDALDKRFNSIPMAQTAEVLMLRKDLRNLPPAQPEIKYLTDVEIASAVGAHTLESMRSWIYVADVLHKLGHEVIERRKHDT